LVRKKWRIPLILLCLTIILSFFPAGVVASEVTIFVDGEEFSGSDQARIISGRTYIPIRSYTELLGFYVDWNEQTREVTITDGEIATVFQLNSRRVVQDGRALYIESRAMIIDGRMYIPLRSVAELYDKAVDWDENSRHVNIREYKTYLVAPWQTFYEISRELRILEKALRVWNNMLEGEPEMGSTIYLESTEKITLDYTLTETVIPYDFDDLEMLAKIIYAEAIGEPYEGMVAVGAVIMNRIKSTSFPNTLQEVIFQRGQFTPIGNGQYNRAKPTDPYYRAAEDALRGIDPVNGALFFNDPVRSKVGYFTRPIIMHIGTHCFYR